MTGQSPPPFKINNSISNNVGVGGYSRVRFSGLLYTCLLSWQFMIDLVVPGYTLKPKPRMHSRWFWSSRLHFLSASDGSQRRKQSSRTDLVCGHAQHLKTRSTAQKMTALRWSTYGFNPFGFRGFIFGLVGSYGLSSAAGDGDHHCKTQKPDISGVSNILKQFLIPSRTWCIQQSRDRQQPSFYQSRDLYSNSEVCGESGH